MRSKTASAKASGKDFAVPRLRFPGFDKHWVFTPLSRLASRSTLRNSSGLTRVLTNSAERGVVDQRDYFEKDIADKESLGNYYVVNEGAYVYNPRISAFAPVGPISKNEVGKGVMSPLYTVFGFNLADDQFYTHFFKSNRWHGFLRANSSTGARHDRMSIGADSFMQMPVPQIELAERQKISACLSSLDVCIGAETRKLDALKAHKQSLMQQLLPAEGERLPRLRFPGFDGKWATCMVGDIMKVGSSKRVHESDWTARGVPFYRARELVALAEGLAITPLHIDEGLYAKHAALTGEVRPGHLLVTGVGSIGVPYLVRKGDKFYFKDGNIIWLKNDESALLGSFLHLLYLTPRIQDQINLMAGIGTVGTYTIDSARKTEISYPLDFAEQEKIADCLLSLNTSISAQSLKVATLRAHKIGLMQGLFPAIESHAS